MCFLLIALWAIVYSLKEIMDCGLTPPQIGSRAETAATIHR